MFTERCCVCYDNFFKVISNYKYCKQCKEGKLCEQCSLIWDKNCPICRQKLDYTEINYTKSYLILGITNLSLFYYLWISYDCVINISKGVNVNQGECYPQQNKFFSEELFYTFLKLFSLVYYLFDIYVKITMLTLILFLCHTLLFTLFIFKKVIRREINRFYMKINS